MSYQSLIFLFVFLPALVVVHRAALAWANPMAHTVLLIGSLVFYALGDWTYLPTLIGSVVFNFLLGRHLNQLPRKATPRKRWTLAGGIVANLLLLASHKYGLVSVERPTVLAGVTALSYAGAIPLGMSFYTLQQITFLVDASRTQRCRTDFVSYTLYVTFLAQVVAGPIVRFTRDGLQFTERVLRRVDREQLHRGIALLVFGLAKKTMLADTLGGIVNPLFTQIADGSQPTMTEAWLAAWGFTLQIYFDFSAYSDMAVGLGLIFGLKLPLNFDSPLKAKSTTDFYCRWHITMTAFIRDFVFQPTLNLVRQRVKGPVVRRMIVAWSVATPVSLIVVGLWHGATTTLVIWGFLAGVSAVAFQLISLALKGSSPAPNPKRRFVWFGHFATLLSLPCITLFFRVENTGDAIVILRSMFSLPDLSWPPVGNAAIWSWEGLRQVGFSSRVASSPLFQLAVVGVGSAVAWWAPNTNSIFRLTHDPSVKPTPTRWYWRESTGWAFVAGMLLVCAILCITYRATLPVFYGRF